ncbi:MAG: hypothetical protein ABR508_05220, partial [Candidatus Baltobacteraceae bacterium]
MPPRRDLMAGSFRLLNIYVHEADKEQVMNSKRTSLERGLILSFAAVIAILIFGVIPTSLWVMAKISTQAETL